MFGVYPHNKYAVEIYISFDGGGPDHGNMRERADNSLSPTRKPFLLSVCRVPGESHAQISRQLKRMLCDRCWEIGRLAMYLDVYGACCREHVTAFPEPRAGEAAFPRQNGSLAGASCKKGIRTHTLFGNGTYDAQKISQTPKWLSILVTPTAAAAIITSP